MSQGEACRDRSHRPAWRVLVREANYSAFNGYRRTPSAYSLLCCRACDQVWRTKAAYVAGTPDAEDSDYGPPRDKGS